jgi:parallel beta-helix repeat protein
MRIPFLATLFLFATFFGMLRAADAAQSYDNCAYFIDTVPVVLDKQGVYCLQKDLSTAQASGSAIEIQTNNVTIDCNDFKLGGLAAGNTSQARGITGYGIQNATIRHCNIRGFNVGIELDDGAGNLVEDNRLDNNLFAGIWIQDSDHSRVRRNAVYDTGGLTGSAYAYGIYAAADIEDNTIDGVFTDAQTVVAYGIYASASGAQINGNRVGGLALNNGGSAFGIVSSNAPLTTIAGNQVVAAAPGTTGWGIRGHETSFCAGNTVANFPFSLYCINGNTSGNLHH